MAARDLFDPTRFSNCGCSEGISDANKNAAKIATREKNSFNKILDKVEKINSNSPFVKKAKELVNISNRIYENGKIPDKFAQGNTGVLDHFGASQLLKVVEKVDVNAVNNVKTVMGNVSDKLRGGNLRLKDMDGLISDVTRLQKYAKGLFGDKNAVPPNDCICSPEVYARHIANDFFPKYASLYAVRFHTNHNAIESFLPKEAPHFEFLCTKISRPSVEYELEEINRYNQRIFVQKKASYGSLTCEFIDDDSNLVHTFMSSMLEYYSPALNLNKGADNAQLFIFADKAAYDKNKNIDDYRNNESQVASSKGPEMGNGAVDLKKSNEIIDFAPLIDRIEIFHLHKFGQQITKYTIYHPVLKSVNFSELTAEGGDIPSISCEFNITNFNATSEKITDNGTISWDFSWNRGNAGGTVLGNYDGKINTKASVLAKLTGPSASPSFTQRIKDRLKESAKNFAKAAADTLKQWAKDQLSSLKKSLFGDITAPKALGKLVNVVKNAGSAFDDAVRGGINNVANSITGYLDKKTKELNDKLRIPVTTKDIANAGDQSKQTDEAANEQPAEKPAPLPFKPTSGSL